MIARVPLATLAAALMVSVPAAQEPSFEVASVKPNKSESHNIGIRFPGVGQFSVVNMPLGEMIRFAHDLQPMQIEGGPDWMSSDRFDIIAKAEGRPTMPQVRAMLRSLIAERFAVRTHVETRQLPIYELVLARADKRLGSQLQPAAAECRPLRMPTGAPKPPPPPPGGGPETIPQPGDGSTLRCGAVFGPGFITIRQFTMPRFARDISMVARRIVVDRTGLEGQYDIDVEFSPEFRPAPPPGAPDFAQPVASDAPSLFTAIQEQLGLKLESARGPVDVLVVDHAERPTPD